MDSIISADATVRGDTFNRYNHKERFLYRLRFDKSDMAQNALDAWA